MPTWYVIWFCDCVALTKQELGAMGELLAQQYIEGQGYRVIATNVRMKRGEIDIVARDHRGLLFAEVKTRTSITFGLPEESMTRQKHLHFLRAVQEYVLRHGFTNIPAQCLVLSLLLDQQNRVKRLSTFAPSFS